MTMMTENYTHDEIVDALVTADGYSKESASLAVGKILSRLIASVDKEKVFAVSLSRKNAIFDECMAKENYDGALKAVVAQDNQCGFNKSNIAVSGEEVITICPPNVRN